MKAAVIGCPVTHTLSPLIFKFLSIKLKSVLDYESIEVRIDDLKEFLFISKKKYRGFNVTIPLKEAAISAVDELSTDAKLIGAINVITYVDDKIIGTNTDIYGIRKTFQRQGFEIRMKNILVIGAGGAARAVVIDLAKNGANRICIYNRGNRGHELIKQFSPHFPDIDFFYSSKIEDFSTQEFSAVVNATPIGMTGKENDADFFNFMYSLRFHESAFAFDLIYTPEITPFLKKSSLLGLKTIGGLGMLVDQAMATWKIWIGDIVNEEKIYQELNDFLKGVLLLRNNRSPIFLTGMMGAGKSSVGDELARLLKFDFIETDMEIGKTSGCTVEELFELEGESKFREIEAEIVRKFIDTDSKVISLGGGSLNGSNIESILTKGKLIWLNASPTVLVDRIESDIKQRPLMKGLTKDNKKLKIEFLLKQREQFYSKAHYCVEVRDKTPEELAIQIIQSMGGARWE